MYLKSIIGKKFKDVKRFPGFLMWSLEHGYTWIDKNGIIRVTSKGRRKYKKKPKSGKLESSSEKRSSTILKRNLYIKCFPELNLVLDYTTKTLSN